MNFVLKEHEKNLQKCIENSAKVEENSEGPTLRPKQFEEKYDIHIL